VTWPSHADDGDQQRTSQQPAIAKVLGEPGTTKLLGAWVAAL